ncbi:uncharacterized protein LOC134244893 [Saccostrea cucullata]|uniref:uncharacterized protein LOC134244893 n=1 Tax=Saccostrea cuccullata TaxID=36930 RepID=UPI002ED5F670
MQQISEELFVGLCRKIGTPKQVAIRRDVMDIAEIVKNRVRECHEMTEILSGSRREGFRFKDSDADCMYCINSYRVIWNLSQIRYYKKETIIICDGSDSPPGFTLLQLAELGSEIKGLFVTMSGKHYISSSIFREVMCSVIHPNSIVHGPCSSGTMVTGGEYDDAICFRSDFWPPSVYSWKERCLVHSWPNMHVVHDIVRSGCHFVAIGHKLGNHEDSEWRVSFSVAEHKLVRCMSHCQFLTYGLLKLFLKEFVNTKLNEEDKFLCSYHMKTAVFWVAQQNTISNWCPQNLMECFWVCFKLILKWVYEGVCPNFFIPENNMFLNYVHQNKQQKTFDILNTVYEMGIASFLHIFSNESVAIHIPRHEYIILNEDTLISETELDMELFREVHKNEAICTLDLHQCMKALQAIEQVIHLPLTPYHTIMLRKHAETIFQRMAFILHNVYTNKVENKRMYTIDKISRYMLKLTAEFGCVSDMLYLAMYYYKTYRYLKALTVLKFTKARLNEQNVMYQNIDENKYIKTVGGQSWSKKMRHALAWNISLFNRICYIKELVPEQQSKILFKQPVSFIPHFLMVSLLDILCNIHIDMKEALVALFNLQHLVYCVHKELGTLGDISWQLLGICQQVTGKHGDALVSYVISLTQIPTLRLQWATIIRILTILFYSYRNQNTSHEA